MPPTTWRCASSENPWDRLAALREALPNICLQMLLRGRNTVGYTPYPELVTSAFVEEATATGIDIYRIFDALNNIDSMRPAIRAVRETGSAVAEVAMSYTGDLSDPAESLYTLDYYLKLADHIVEAGAMSSLSRTWQACCGHRRHIRWSARYAAASTCPSMYTLTTRRAASSPPMSRLGRQALTQLTEPPRRLPESPASPR